MTRDEIISMAREAGCYVRSYTINVPVEHYEFDVLKLERFAALVAGCEREELLDLVESYAKNNADLKDAICARAEKETK